MIRIRIVRTQRSRRHVRRSELAALVLLAAGICTLPAAAASGTGSVAATIHVGSSVLSLTVSPSTFDYCTSGTPLTFPNGFCGASSPVTVTMGSVGGHIDVNGADALPSDSGTPWTLCDGTGGGPACAAPRTPGPDQYLEGQIINLAPALNSFLYDSPECDVAFGSACQASAGASVAEQYAMTGPSSSTSTASSFSTTITWTALP
jgi:hypothetical protein